MEDGGIRIVEMLYRSNLLVLVGGGRNPRFPSNKVVIYDHRAGQFVAELEFRSDVKAVKVRKDFLVVVLLSKIFVYSFSAAPEKLSHFETADNEAGVVALSISEDKPILAFPAEQKVARNDDLLKGQTTMIKAHKSQIAVSLLTRWYPMRLHQHREREL